MMARTEHVTSTSVNIPRVIVSGLSGSSGKTLVSLGLARAFTDQGLAVKTFKKGPDYIDVAWLASSAKSAQGTLDPYFSSAKDLISLFSHGTINHNFCIIEGNRGLFDGLDAQGSCSTAYLAKLLKAPVILVIDCTKMTRTVAAIIHGCNTFDPDLNISGVILNRVSTKRQEKIICESLEGRMPVLGVLPKNKEPFIKERHMGLQCLAENIHAQQVITRIEAFITEHVDLLAIKKIADQAPNFTEEKQKIATTHQTILGQERDSKKDSKANVPEKNLATTSFNAKKPTIGYVYDAALWFYYHENLQALVEAGANVVPISLLSPHTWPKLDGLYLGGGLPELYASELSVEKHHKQTIRSMAYNGLPIYAECGGLIYLASSLTAKGKDYEMAGVLPIEIELGERPSALGYVSATALLDNPFHPKGCLFRGHEFHFSYCKSPISLPMSLSIEKGEGIGSHGAHPKKDGIIFLNTFASYMHIYAPSVTHWAPAFVTSCARQQG